MGRRVLIVRADRIGDVVLSTPAFRAVKEAEPGSTVTVLLREAVRPLVQGLDFVDGVMTYDPSGRHSGLSGWLGLVKEIREKAFDVVVCLQSQARIAAALAMAKVPVRVGPLSKPHSFLFYNRGLRQRRSRVEKHEADYNLELLQQIGIQPVEPLSTRVHVPSDEVAWAKGYLSGLGVSLETGPSDKKLVLVHPGMGGSALNWPLQSYLQLVNRLLEDGVSVLVTGGPLERDLVEIFREKCPGVMIYVAEEGDSISRMAALTQLARLVVVPSTGPLHIAVALGRPVVTFFPPIRVQSSRRWGPYHPSGLASVFEPHTEAGENSVEAMGKITVTQTLKAINNHLYGEK